ncbi:restriction endonuclease subunit S [Acetobacter sp. P5B1]|uniref:restriction endonuclease subunit S n=1 Tax=Acetobacter sp. P5B1 TaxID=2762620 RepID=UPI001C03DA75|nr:restriction endonuclease subunit S [Acetobacter sp. P5B1]
MLPEDWKKRSVAEVCRSVSVGVVIKPSQYYVSASEGIKAFRSANVKEGQVNNSDWVYFSHKGHNENKKSELKTGDVLVVRTGYPGTACVVTPQYAGCNAIDVVIARPDIQKIIPTYLCLFTNSEYGKSQVANLQGGMAQKHLNVGAYQQVEIPLPPLPEQKKIAAILSTWDRAIDGTEKLLANSQQQKKALMQQLLTGKKRLSGFTGEWKKVSLEKTGKIVSGGTPDTTVPAYWDGDVLWLTPTDVTSLRGKYVDDTKRKITQTGIKDSSTILLPVGSLLVCTRATIGYMAIAKKPITTNQGFKNIVFNKLFLPEFVYYFLCTQKHEIQRLASGSTFAEISKKDFGKIHISAPLLPEQKAIAAVLTTADEELAALESDLARLRQEKKALMQQLLTGKRRVTVD